MSSKNPTTVQLTQKLPARLSREALVLIDRRLLKLPAVHRWVQNFDHLAVSAGEKLKSLERLQALLPKVIQMTARRSPQALQIVAVGGGSVGDFAGFLASVLKRGVRLVQIPSTWLAAIDSAHGGKTALNVGGYKNQIGSFYPAETVYLVKDLLCAQPLALAHDGLGELVKIALIEGRELWRSLQKHAHRPADRLLFQLLDAAVAAKYKVVRKDPYETKGVRQVLNLGHTVGHVFEAHHGLSHGRAVTQGLFFALDWSRARQILSARRHQKITQQMHQLGLHPKNLPPLAAKTFARHLAQDKKISTSGRMRFVFIKEPGRPLIQEVSLAELSAFASTSGLVR